MENINSIIMNQIKNQNDELEPISYIWEMNRLKSLQNWTMPKPSAKEVAEAGFYCPMPDTPDTVRCFSCFIELHGWEPTDQPWVEHKNRNLSCKPPCKFIEIGKKESELTVNDFLNIKESVMLRTLYNKCETLKKIELNYLKKKKTALKKELKKKGIS